MKFIFFALGSTSDAVDSASLLQLSSPSSNLKSDKGKVHQTVLGYKELLNSGNSGPCRLNSPTDNDISAWEGNKVWGGTVNCDVCAALCDQDVDLFGNPRKCKAMECSPNADGQLGINGALCELWSKKPKFAGATAVNQGEGEDVSSSGTGTASGLHCYVKDKKQKEEVANAAKSKLTVLAPVYEEVKTAGRSGPCRGTSSTDRDESAHENNKIVDAGMTIDKCAAKCANNKDETTGDDRVCLAFEFHGGDDDSVAHCELWNKQPHFVAETACNSGNCEDLVSASTYQCFSKKPATLTTLSGVYTELFNDAGTSGPCRGTSADDDDREAYAGNKIWAEGVTCDKCAALCAQDIDLEGNDRECKAFECTGGDADSEPHCELWTKPANFAGNVAFNNGDASDVTSAATYHCFSK